MIGVQLYFEDLRWLLRGMVLNRNADGTRANPPASKGSSTGHALNIMINPDELDVLRKQIPRELWECPDFDQTEEDKHDEQE